jgi:hypothetical protein
LRAVPLRFARRATKIKEIRAARKKHTTCGNFSSMFDCWIHFISSPLHGEKSGRWMFWQALCYFKSKPSSRYLLQSTFLLIAIQVRRSTAVA